MTDHIKIYGVKPRIQYVANGTSTVYEFPFAIFDASDVDVYLNDTKQASTSFTVSGVRDSDGGSVTFATAPASGVIVSLVRNLSIARTSDFQEGGALRANVLNDELDYQIACQQQIAENLNRSMVLPPYAVDSELDLTLPTPSAGKAIVWNSDGTNLENSTVSVNALESTLKGYKEIAESAASTATTKAGIASDKADIASDKADIATEKAAEAASTVSGKADKDMDNLTATGKAAVIALIMPDHASAVSCSDDTEYTATTNGWLEIFSRCFNNATAVTATIDGVVHNVNQADSSHLNLGYALIPIKKGSTYKVKYTRTDTVQYIKFYPCLGG